MGWTIGIDLRTPKSRVAIMKGKAAEALEDGERLVCRSARRQSVTRPANAFPTILRLIGRPFDDPLGIKVKGGVPHEIVPGPNGEAKARASDAVQEGKPSATDRERIDREADGVIDHDLARA
jgi:molecular chaperone DnaK